MPDIQESIQIDVPSSVVRDLVDSAEGLAKWWAEDITRRTDGVLDLGFFNRATVYSLQPAKKATSHIEWLCLSGKEWKGTKLRFELNEDKGKTLLRFTHADWEAHTDYLVSCNTTWGAL